jgi:hypothetical protein
MNIRGIIPQDLPLQNTFWRQLNLEERIFWFKKAIKVYDKDLAASLIATTMIEQPKRFPNNNLLGWGVWGKNYPWGWKVMKGLWDKKTAIPNGYIIVKEGWGGKQAVLFSFTFATHCLISGYYLWERRGILKFKDYEKYWLGGSNPQAKKDWEEFFELAKRIL